MASTYELIASTTLGSSAADVTLSSLPATYDDLAISISARSDRSLGIDALRMQFNSDTGANYAGRYLYGSGSAATSGVTDTTYVYCGYCDAATATSNTFSSAEVYIPNYAGSAYKSVSVTQAQEDNATAAYIWVSAHLWSSTSAISSVKIYPAVGNLVSGSSVYLFGVTHA